jgi:hypothetical protein
MISDSSVGSQPQALLQGLFYFNARNIPDPRRRTSSYRLDEQCAVPRSVNEAPAGTIAEEQLQRPHLSAGGHLDARGSRGQTPTGAQDAVDARPTLEPGASGQHVGRDVVLFQPSAKRMCGEVCLLPHDNSIVVYGAFTMGSADIAFECRRYRHCFRALRLMVGAYVKIKAYGDNRRVYGGRSALFQRPARCVSFEHAEVVLFEVELDAMNPAVVALILLGLGSLGQHAFVKLFLRLC